jgi:hypothetical protein
MEGSRKEVNLKTLPCDIGFNIHGFLMVLFFVISPLICVINIAILTENSNQSFNA